MFIIRFIFRNIKEKKFRLFLIIFSISISTALFFASNSLALTMKKMYLNFRRSWYGSADIMIQPNNSSPGEYYLLDKAKSLNDKLEYIVGTMRGSCNYKPSFDETFSITLYGFHFDELQMYNPVMIIKKSHLLPFEGRKIIFNKFFLDKYSLKVGDYIDVFMGNDQFKFLIAASVEPDGIFRQVSDSTTAVIPLSKLSELFSKKGRVEETFIKLKNRDQLYPIIDELSKLYNRYTVRETITQRELSRYSNEISIPFKIMTVFVLFMSIFIIYSSFKVITAERLPLIGTMRSIGATKKTTDFLLIFESVFYGIIGGFIGILLGFAILYVMSYIQSYNPWMKTRVRVIIDFSYLYLALSFILGIILSIAGSIIPIIKVSKIPIKDIILNKVDIKYEKKEWRIITGIIFIAGSLLVPFFAPKRFALPIDTVCILMLFTGTVFLVPWLTSMFVKFFSRLYIYIFGNIGVIAVRNLRENKNILNSISLLSIGIAGLLMINTISFSVNKEILHFYNHANYDIQIWFWHANRYIEKIVRSVKGVTDTYGIYQARDVEIKDFKDNIRLVHGINNKYPEYWDFNIKESLLNNLQNGRNILVTQTLKEKFSLKNNSIITISTKRGERQYRVIGFFNSIMYNGDYALVAEKYLKMDMQVKYYDSIYIKTSEDPDEFVSKIKKRYGRMRGALRTVNEMAENNKQSNRQLFIILQGFSVLAMVIGVFGVLNNFVINFIQRKRILAVFRSVGMSKKQLVSMIFLESLTGGMISGIMGVISGFLVLQIIPFIMFAIDQNISMHYSVLQFFLFLISGMFISLAGSISPALSSSKLNIIESIKYE